MATHDYVIANASGAAVRTDLNNALVAIVTNNSNATAPATTYAYQWWADTTASQLKLRNAANDDWIVVAELDGTKLLEDGTAAAPGLAFVDDVDTGLFSPAADTFAVAVGGSEIARFDSSGRLLVGATTARANLFNGTVSAALQIEGTETDDRILSIVSSNSTGTAGPRLALGHQLSGTLGGNTIVSSDTDLGSLVFQGSDGSDFVVAAQIVAQVDATPGADDMPGRLMFFTTADGSSSSTERMRIGRSGLVHISNNTADTTRFGSTPAHLIHQSTATYGLVVESSSSTYPDGILIDFDDASPDDNVQRFISCTDSTTERMRVWSDGDLDNHDNSYGAISDQKLKQDIVDAGSQWDDIKSLRVRKWRFIDDVAAYGDEAKTLIGVVAQEAETVSPGLIKNNPDFDEDGNDLGTVTKSVRYSVLYMKAIKALQEAQTRIETLETQHADLLARVAALEAA